MNIPPHRSYLSTPPQQFHIDLQKRLYYRETNSAFFLCNRANVYQTFLTLYATQIIKPKYIYTSSFFISARAMNLNILRVLKLHIQQNIEYPQNGSEVAKTI